MKAYLIGSLRNPRVPVVAELLREQLGWDIFDAWYAAGPDADDAWRAYENGLGHDLPQALEGLAAIHVFDFDYLHLAASDAGILLLPAGKSAHLELGWMAGQEKKTFVILDKDPERYDVMYRLCDQVYNTVEDFINDRRGR